MSSEAATQGVRVSVEASYLEAQSKAHGQHVFTYEVTIVNVGSVAVQLLSRHWIIVDGDEAEQHVEGPGVVGEQPRLGVGDRFTYQSFCPLHHREGSMRGSYEMKRDDGSTFDAEVALFALSVPRPLN